MADIKCSCGHDASDHIEDYGCKGGIDDYCDCPMDAKQIYEQRIYSLETDVIHARRVADERQEVIKEITGYLREALDNVYRYDLVTQYHKIKVNLMKVSDGK